MKFKENIVLCLYCMVLLVLIIDWKQLTIILSNLEPN
jgi:hypothetical protein